MTQEYLEAIKNKGVKRQQLLSKKSVIKNFFKSCAKNFDQVEENDIAAWVKKLNNSGRTRFTIHVYLYLIRNLYYYCLSNGLVSNNPALTVKTPWAHKPARDCWDANVEGIIPEHQKILAEYLKNMKLNNISEGTVSLYRRYLDKFLLANPMPLRSLTPDLVLSWIRANYWDKAPKTLTICLSALSSFFNFCQTEEYVGICLIKKRWYPRLPKPIPKFLTRSEQARVRLQTEKDTIRNRALVEFFLSSGCRLAEVRGLNIEDIDIAEKTARVTGKGEKLRDVFFSDTCAILLEKYLKSRPSDQNALFLSAFKRRLSKSQIRGIIKKIGDKAEVARSLSPHCFRHTFSTNLLSKGAELDFIAELLGHEDLQTTRVYAHYPKEELIGLYRKYMG